MKKSRKKAKGMTLVEMIISIAIFGIMGGLLILVGTHIDATTRAGNNLKHKVTVESPYAANHKKTYKDGVDDVDIPKSEMDITIKLTIPDEVSVWKKETDEVTKEVKEVEYTYSGDVELDLKADKYETESIITKDMTDEQIKLMRKRANGGLNLEFFELQKETPTEATT